MNYIQNNFIVVANYFSVFSPLSLCGVVLAMCFVKRNIVAQRSRRVVVSQERNERGFVALSPESQSVIGLLAGIDEQEI